MGLQDRLRPGRMLLVDTLEKKIEEDGDLKMRIALSRPHKKLCVRRMYLDQFRKDDIVSPTTVPPINPQTIPSCCHFQLILVLFSGHLSSSIPLLPHASRRYNSWIGGVVSTFLPSCTSQNLWRREEEERNVQFTGGDASCLSIVATVPLFLILVVNFSTVNSRVYVNVPKW